MPHVSKENFVRRVAQNLDLPEALVERLTEPRAPDDGRGEGWKIVRMPWIEELKEGPRYAEVTNIDQESKDFTGKLPDFDVKF